MGRRRSPYLLVRYKQETPHAKIALSFFTLLWGKIVAFLLGSTCAHVVHAALLSGPSGIRLAFFMCSRGGPGKMKGKIRCIIDLSSFKRADFV
jgi:ABC-type phosphate transport system permease subunit